MGLGRFSCLLLALMFLAGGCKKKPTATTPPPPPPKKPSGSTTPLHRAAKTGDARRTQLLISQAADVDARDEYGKTPLHFAAFEGHAGIAELLLAGGADVNAKDEGGGTPLDYAFVLGEEDVAELLVRNGAEIDAEHLHLAAELGYTAVAELLLAGGADLNIKDGSGKTPLYFAAYEGHAEMAELLLARGAEIDAEHLYSAASRGHTRVAEMLIAKGADVKAKRVSSKRTSLHGAAEGRHVKIVELLVANGADVNAQDKSGWTPLHAGAAGGDTEVAKLLLARSAKVNARTTSGSHDRDGSPLHVAAWWGHEDVVSLLLTHGAAIDARNLAGDTPLLMAVMRGQTEAAQVLIAQGADTNARDAQGLTLLHTAVTVGDSRMADLLIANGADLSATDGRGWTPLLCAVLGWSPSTRADVIGVLLARGANVNAKTSSGSTPLHYAAREDRVRMVELLLAHGADVNAATRSGHTPLHNAARRGHYDTVELLLANAASAEAKNKEGKIPLDYARAAGRTDIVALLSGKGGNIGANGPRDGTLSASAKAVQAKAIPEPTTDLEKLVRGNCVFALDLYRELRSSQGNLFFSPYSISTALGMTYAAAREKTAKEMAETLHFSLKQEALHPAFAELQDALNKIQQAGDVKLHVANSLWPQRGHPFLEEYLSLVKMHYGVSVLPVNYQTEEAREVTRQTINTWVEEKTEDKIRELIQPKHLEALTRLVLTNAIYFRGKWANEFDPKDTRDAPFYISAKRPLQVPTMWQEERFRYGEVGSLQILELRYRGNGLSMLVLLPRRIEGLRQLEDALSVESLYFWRQHLTDREVIVYLPKSKVTCAIELKETLRAMGMVEAFTWPGANFAGFDGDPLWFYISKVIHKAFVDVNEEGTEAAAATAVVATMGGMPPSPPVFRADHPFLFLIQDNRTGSILFMGRVTDPTKASQ